MTFTEFLGLVLAVLNNTPSWDEKKIADFTDVLLSEKGMIDHLLGEYNQMDIEEEELRTVLQILGIGMSMGWVATSVYQSRMRDMLRSVNCPN